MSALVTIAPATETLPPSILTGSSLPLTVLTICPSFRSVDIALAGTTCAVRIAVSFSLFSGFSSVSTVPAGSLAKASSVGAKTVNGPGPLSVSTSPAACRAAASVLNDPAATAVSTMSLVDSAANGAGAGAVTAGAAVVPFTGAAESVSAEASQP